MQRVGVAIASLVALTFAGACGGGSEGTVAFCDDLSTIEESLDPFQQDEVKGITDIADTLEAIYPPDEIAEAYDNIVEVYRSMDDEQSITDPAFATRFADVSSDISEVQAYITDHCTDEDPSDG